VGNFNIFSYLVGDKETGEGLFIDPASRCDQLIQEAKSHELTIKYIVNTHCHIDHVMGNREMVAKTGAKVIIHEADKDGMQDTPPDVLAMFQAENPPPPDILVKDSDLIEVGNISLKVIHTPGHTVGGMCLYSEGMVFTGDSLFVGSIGRTDFPGSSYEDLENSIRNRLYTLPEDTVVFPGHNYGQSPTSSIGQEMRSNAFVRA
jgi:glyoxylase-like metal-dependent hydrolase (beta-lactamase superfamily II)